MKSIVLLLLFFSSCALLRSASDISSDFGKNVDSEIEKSGWILPQKAANKAKAMSDYAIAVMDASEDADKSQIIDKFLEVIKNDPYADTPLFLLLSSFKNVKNKKKIVKELSLSAIKNPDALKLNVTVAASLLSGKDFKEAREMLEKTYSVTKDKYSVLTPKEKIFYENMIEMLAKIYSEKGEFDKGDELFENIIEDNEKLENNFGIRRSAIEFYRKASEKSDNSSWLWFLEGDKDRYKRKMDENLKAIELLCDKSYNDPFKLLPILEIYKENGQNKKAVELLIQNLLSDPDDIKTMTVLAILYYELGEYNNSFRLWKTINRKSSSQNQSNFLELARSAIRFEEYKEAAKALEWYLISNHEDNNAKYLLAICYFEMEMYRKCIKKLSKMQSFESYYLAGISYRNLRKYKKAEEKLVAAEKWATDKNKIDHLNKNFYITLAFVAEKAGHFKRAVKSLEKLLKDDPNDHEAQNFLGYIWADHDTNLDEAQKLIASALKEKPDSSAYLDSMAWVLYKKKDYKEALQYIKRALKEAGDVPDAVIADHAGDIYYALKDLQKALEYWKLASGIYSEDLDRDKLLEKIKKLQPR
jgi:tetratricopeptide (TPR) repeat protein